MHQMPMKLMRSIHQFGENYLLNAKHKEKAESQQINYEMHY